jgi:hypothetical protein
MGSNTASAPRPPVAVRTASGTLWLARSMACRAPAARTASVRLPLAIPMTSAPFFCQNRNQHPAHGPGGAPYHGDALLERPNACQAGGGQTRNRQARSVLEAQRARNGRQLGSGRRDEGGARPEQARPTDARARRNACLASGFHDRARSLSAQCIRKGHADSVGSRPDQRLRVVEAGGFDPYTRLVRLERAIFSTTTSMTSGLPAPRASATRRSVAETEPTPIPY